MFLVIHVLLGALIGLSFNSVLLVVVLAFVSHFLLDMVPHWDGAFDLAHFKKHFVPIYKKSFVYQTVIDIVLVLLVTILLYNHFGSGLVVIGAFAAVFPDVLKLGYFTKLKKYRWYRNHLMFHADIQGEASWLPGMLTQFLTLLVLLKFLFF